jgi:hypothetical protein
VAAALAAILEYSIRLDLDDMVAKPGCRPHIPAPAALMTWESERAVVKLRVTGEPSGTHNEDRGQGEWYRSTTPSR